MTHWMPDWRPNRTHFRVPRSQSSTSSSFDHIPLVIRVNRKNRTLHKRQTPNKIQLSRKYLIIRCIVFFPFLSPFQLWWTQRSHSEKNIWRLRWIWLCIATGRVAIRRCTLLNTWLGWVGGVKIRELMIYSMMCKHAHQHKTHHAPHAKKAINLICVLLRLFFRFEWEAVEYLRVIVNVSATCVRFQAVARKRFHYIEAFRCGAEMCP